MTTHDHLVTIGGITFDRVRYDADADADADADVLYLHVGDPATAVAFDETPEGHHIRLDATGRVVGLTMVGVGSDLRAGRPVTVTLPERVEVDPAELRALVSAA